MHWFCIQYLCLYTPHSITTMFNIISPRSSKCYDFLHNMKILKWLWIKFSFWLLFRIVCYLVQWRSFSCECITREVFLKIFWSFADHLWSWVIMTYNGENGHELFMVMTEIHLECVLSNVILLMKRYNHNLQIKSPLFCLLCELFKSVISSCMTDLFHWINPWYLRCMNVAVILFLMIVFVYVSALCQSKKY